MEERPRLPDVQKRRPGRPALDPEDRWSEKLQIHVTPDEADSVHREALRQGLTTSEYLRAKLGFPIQTIPPLTN